MQHAPTPSSASLRRQRVHDAVRELVGEQGFRVSMDKGAARAGCSEQTLYSHFGSSSVMQEHLDMATARLDGNGKSGDGVDDPRASLPGFAMGHLQRLSDPSVIASCQSPSAEVPRFSVEARTLYRNGGETRQQRPGMTIRTTPLDSCRA